jgi:hypothetical protein
MRDVVRASGRWLVGLLVVLTGCAGTPRTFLHDTHLQITAPAPLTTVSLPFTVAWSTTRRGDGAYAVFVDRSPVPPGHTLRDVADAQCKRVTHCPDAAYLAGRGVYVTPSDQLQIDTLPLVGGTAGRARSPAHTIAIVALDAQGRRRGDNIWTVEFRG